MRLLDDYKVKLELYNVIEKMYDRPNRYKTHKQLDKFNENIGMFGLSATKAMTKMFQLPTSG